VNGESSQRTAFSAPLNAGKLEVGTDGSDATVDRPGSDVDVVDESASSDRIDVAAEVCVGRSHTESSVGIARVENKRGRGRGMERKGGNGIRRRRC
jgi:hypothetical protein